MKFTNLDNEYNSINVLDKPLDFVNVESEENDFLLLNPVVIEVPNVKESLEEEPSIVIKTPNVYKCLPEYLEVENALSEFNTEELKQRARENLNIKSLDESKFYTKEEIDNKGFITDISNKQDVISDLDNIRSGASKGATAVLPETLATLMIQMQDLIARVEALENPGVAAEVSSNNLTFTNGAEVKTNNLSLIGNNIDITNNNLKI